MSVCQRKWMCIVVHITYALAIAHCQYVIRLRLGQCKVSYPRQQNEEEDSFHPQSHFRYL